MGILNITPDSFSDGGKYFSSNDGNGKSGENGENIHSRLQERMLEMISEGADIIDIGAESTFGPEAQVTAEEEWGRLEPVLKILPEGENGYSRPPTQSNGIFISVDTWKADVADKALQSGAQMINDVTALCGDPKMIEVLLKHQPYVCLMYSAYDTPYAGREDIQYDDVMKTIKEFLDERTKKLTTRGFPKEKIMVDPGLGFFLSADPKYSWEVIERLGELKELGFPILIGPSMKSFLGGEIKDRLPKSLEAAKRCFENGASIIRVHHVKEHKDLYNRLTSS